MGAQRSDAPRIVLLVNPASGNGRAGQRAPVVARRLRERGARIEVVTGTSRADASTRLAAALAVPADAVMACGGDGTVHQALQQVVGTPVALAIAPMGTGNDVAGSLGIPRDPVAAADVAADALAGRTGRTGVVRTIDSGEVTAADGSRCSFLAVMSSGFDSAVNERANRLRWPSGRARYVRAILAELRVFRAVPYRMVLDAGLPTETSCELRGMLVAVGNGPSYGGGMQVCPAAELDDGLLDVTLLAELRTVTFLRVFPSVFRGTHVRRPEVRTGTARTVRLDAPGQVAYADGEPVGPLPVTVTLRPGSVRVLAPAGALR